MQYVYIVFGAYNDTDSQDLLGVYATSEAAEERIRRIRIDKDLDVEFAFVYKAAVGADVEF